MGFTGGYYTGRGSDSSAAFMAVFLVLAVVLTVLAFIFIVPENRRAKLNAFGKFLHDTCNFNYLLIEKLLQALYIFLTVFSILTGVYTLFQSFGMGLLMMIGLPLLIRLIYEFLMMTVLLLKHVIMIDNKLKNQNTGDKKQQPEALFCEPRTEKSLLLHRQRACKRKQLLQRSQRQNLQRRDRLSRRSQRQNLQRRDRLSQRSQRQKKRFLQQSRLLSAQHRKHPRQRLRKSRLLSKRYRKHRPDPKQFSVQSVVPDWMKTASVRIVGNKTGHGRL